MNIKISSLITFLVLFINVPPPYFCINTSFSNIIELLQILCFAFILLYYVTCVKSYKISSIIILITLFWLIYIFSTKIHGGSIMAALKPLIVTLNLCLLFEIQKNRHMDSFISNSLIYFFIIVTINLFTIILFPNGLYEAYKNVNSHYFLGHRNNSIEYIIPLILFTFLKDYIKNKRNSIYSIIILIIAAATVLMTWSANAIIVMLFLIISLLLPSRKFIQEKLNGFIYLISYLVFVYAIIIKELQYKFAWFIEGILHRSLNFTYRTYIWKKSINWINKSFIIGYGYEDVALKALKIGHSNSCHNYLLDYLYMGGIVLTIIIFFILIVCFLMLKKNQSKFSKLFNCIFGAYFILWFATPIHKDILGIMFLVFVMAYNVKCFNKVEGEQNE